MRRYLPVLLIVIWCLWGLCACQQTGPAAESTPPPAEQTQPVPAQTQPAEVTPPPSETPSQPPVEETPPVETGEPVPDVVVYSFGAAVEESEPVEMEWFADAAFVGDSRTEGLQLFSGLRAGDFFWGKGMNVFKAVDREAKVVRQGEETLSILEALERKEYAKVYIMIGINELGYSNTSYENGLRTLIDAVKAIQPNAVIYLQTLPPVNEGMAMAHGLGSYVKNSKVNAFNEIIWRVAWEKQVALLDVASVYRTEAGELAAEMAADGVHFYRQGYAAWYDYLKSHTVDPAAYQNGAPLEAPVVPDVPEPPVYTQPPAESQDPAVTETPAPTETPAVTEPPAPTETPAVTESPAPTETPAATETPAPTETPAVTETPVPTDSPAPAETETPAPTEMVPPAGTPGTP